MSVTETKEAKNCPKCGSDEWNGTDCANCKYDARWASSVDGDQSRAEASYLYGTDPRYGVKVEVDYHLYPHSTAYFSATEARKFAISILLAAEEADLQTARFNS